MQIKDIAKEFEKVLLKVYYFKLRVRTFSENLDSFYSNRCRAWGKIYDASSTKVVPFVKMVKTVTKQISWSY